jgi:hypothetical protein
VARCLAQKGPFFAILRPFFDRGAAMAYKNPLRLAKNDHFFDSDATTPTVTNLFYFCVHLKPFLVGSGRKKFPF